MRSFAGMRALAGWALFFLALGFAAVFALPAQASTHKPPTWTQRTCTAFSAWERHPSLDRLETAVSDSFRIRGRSYLAADLGQLWADSVSPKSNAQYVDTDRQYVYEDCHNGSGL